MRPRIALLLAAAATVVVGLNGPGMSSSGQSPSTPAAQSPAPSFAVRSWQPKQAVPDPAKINPAYYKKGHGPNVSGRVVLTYDDCPRTLYDYRRVLTYAQASDIGVVIAPTGACHRKFLAKYGVDIALLARRHGQYVINHTSTHPNLTKLGYAKAKAQISGWVQSDYGRPPYGARNATVDRAYADAGMRQWLWDVDTNDWRGKSRKQVVDFAVAHACLNCTVLMHLQHKGFDPAAIAAINTGLRARGLYLCRAYRGWDSTGPVEIAPARLGDNTLPC